MAIKTISIQGYRSIQNMRLTMDDINVIVGANGCGKSNLYKAVYLLAKAVNGELAETLAHEGGMPSVLWAGKKKKITQSKAPVRMILSIQTDDFNYEIACGLPGVLAGNRQNFRTIFRHNRSFRITQENIVYY